METIDCPVCACPIDRRATDELHRCPCCETVWIADAERLDRILVGSEG